MTVPVWDQFGHIVAVYFLYTVAHKGHETPAIYLGKFEW